jgi:mannose-6-phosphate isomerase-like protein (cupin superfamily)
VFEWYMLTLVNSTPGARTFWHTHERGQILTVTLGYGLICSKGQEPRRLQVGDVVHIPAGETHWHGGTNTTCMAHTAISLGSKFDLCVSMMLVDLSVETSWHDEVKQEEYEQAHKTAK